MRKFTIEDVKKTCDEIGLTCLSTTYGGVKDKLDLICTSCDEVFQRNYDNILTRRNTVCRKCGLKEGHKKQTFGYDEVKSFIENESDCKLLSDEYINIDSKLSIQCKCCNVFEATFYKFKEKNKRQCTKCGRKATAEKLLTKEEDIIKELNSYGYTYIQRDAESGGDQRVLVKCEKDHEPYWVTFVKFRNSGRRCPHCKRSLGEDYVKSELDKHGVLYIQQQTFFGLRGIGGNPLRYDFSLLSNNKIIALVEYDGKQHFEVAFDDEEGFKRTQIHDKLKDEFAEKECIPLYRIHYEDYDNIPYIIEDILSKVEEIV